MHVISGKAPTELGLNGAPEAEAVTESSQQKISSSRDGAKETAAPSAPSMNVTAEDLCGTPVVPIVPGPVAYEPIVYEVVTGEDEVEAAPTVSLPHEEIPTQVVSAPEWSGLLSFKRPTGPQLVDTGRAQVLPPVTNQSLAVQLLRDDAPYEAPPASEVTRSIANSLRSGLSSTSETTAEPIDPLDLVRDPDYYEEKMRTREAEKVAVDWVQPERAAPVHKAEPITPAFETEPDLVQVVKHEAPIAAVHANPFAGVAENSQPSMQVGTAEAAPAVEVVAPATVSTVEVEPVAAAVAEPVVAAAAKVPDPFAGIEFGTTPAPEEQAAPAVAAPLEVPDPFAGVEFGTTSAPVAVEAVPEIAAAKPEVAVAAPEPVVEPVIEAASEPELTVAPKVAPAPTVPAVPDPFAGIDFGTRPVEAETAEPIAAIVPEFVAAPAEAEAAVAAAEPEAVEVAHESQVVAQEPEVVEAAALAESVTMMPEPVIEPEVVPEAEAVAPVAEPEVPATPAVAAMPAFLDPFAAIGFGTEQVAAVEAPEPIAIEAEREVVAAAPEIVTAPEPEPVIEPVEVAEPEAVEITSHAAEVVPEAAAVMEAAQEPEAVEVPSEAEVVPEAEAAPAAEAPVRSWSWMVPEAPPVMPEIAARGAQETEAARDTEFKPVIAAEVSQPQAGILQPGKAFAEAGAVPPGEAKPEDLSAAIKTLMQLGSVLPLAARMAPREGEAVQEPVAVDTQEVKQEVSGLRLLQYEIKTTVQDQSMHLKRLEDQLARMRESAEMDSAESASAMDNMKSTAKMVRVMGIGLGVMLLVLILLIGMVLMHVK